MNKPWMETPLVESTVLSRAAGCRIFLKLENLQPSTSFKSRGIGNLILSHIESQRNSPTDDRPVHFYCSSGGNAGLACVLAASSLGYPSSIVVPTSIDEFMVAKLLAAGATDVIVHGDSWINADEYLRQTLMPKGEEEGQKAVYIPPFDHPVIWEGAGTMVEEIKHQMLNEEKPDAIVCSVGGGGLLAGIINGLDRVGWSENTSSSAVQVLALETSGADSLSQSLAQNTLVTLPGITSVAKSLGAVRVASHVFSTAQSRPHQISSIVLSDAEACAACWRFADDERFLVEPACGASLAVAYNSEKFLRKYIKGFGRETKVVIIVCGGSRISLELMQEYKTRYAQEAEQLGFSQREDVPSSFTT